MIARETVVRIIESNSKSASASKKQKEIAGNYQWSKSRQDLCEEIANLSDNDLLDLLALMDYGRELTRSEISPALSSYEVIRQNTMTGTPTLSRAIKSEKAHYLLTISELSSYLRAALPLFDIKEFNF